MNWLKMTAAACALFLVSGCGAQQAVEERCGKGRR